MGKRGTLFLWRKNVNNCYVIDDVVGLDVNVKLSAKTSIIFNSVQNLIDYMLTSRSKLYRYQLEPTGLIKKSLATNLEKIGIEKIPKIIKRLPEKALLGTLIKVLTRFSTTLVVGGLPTKSDFGPNVFLCGTFIPLWYTGSKPRVQ